MRLETRKPFRILVAGGVDLNHRPLGYEFDSCFTVIHADPYISEG
jgi:hypothetical protein